MVDTDVHEVYAFNTQLIVCYTAYPMANWYRMIVGASQDIQYLWSTEIGLPSSIRYGVHAVHLTVGWIIQGMPKFAMGFDY